jgi:hypothetical protein
MKEHIKIFLAILTAILTLTTMISCTQTSKTQYLPTGGSGGPAVSGSAVLLNTATEAANSTDVRYAYDNAGNGLAIWYSYTAYGSRFLYSVYNPAKGTWSHAEEFFKNIDTPSIASTGTGIMVVFSLDQAVYARPWSSGTFGAPVKINTGAGNCYNATITSNGTGYGVAWRQYDTDRYNVHAVVYSGTAWGTPASLENTSGSPSGIGITAGGASYCVTWWEDSVNRFYASINNGSWTAAQEIDNGSYPYSTKVAGNNAGTFIYVFYDADYNIYARVFTGSSWGSVQDIDAGTNQAYIPDIASNGTTFNAVWYQSDSSNSRIYSSIYNAGSWTSAAAIDSGGYSASSPHIASDGTGYCATWQQSDGLTEKIYASRYVTAAWQAPELLNPSSTVNASFPYVSSNGSGYMAWWQEYNSNSPLYGTFYNLYASSFSGSAWSSPAQIDNGPHSYVYMGMIPFTVGYGFSFNYAENDSIGLLANVYRNSAWGGAVDLVAGQRHGSCMTIYQVPLLVRAGAETVAVWKQYDKSYGGTQKLYASVKTGSKWGALLLLADQTAGSYGAASSGSSVCVAWIAYDSTTGENRYVLKGKIYSGGAWGADTIIDNDVATYYSENPIVAGNASTNDFCVIWYQSDGVYNRVYANMHTATGWAGPHQIDNSGMDKNAYPDYLAAGTSRYCAVFDQDGLNYGTVYTGSAWTTPTLLYGSPIYPDKNTMAASGDNFAITQDISGDIYTNMYDGSTWSGMELQDKVSGDSSYTSTVMGDGAGGFCLAWYESYGGNSLITSRIYDSSLSSWGVADIITPLPIGSDTINENFPRIASNGSGYAVTFYSHDIYGTYSLYANVYDSGSWLGSDLVENNLSSIAPYNYSIASNGSGYGLVWWQYDTAFNLMLYGNVYDGASWKGQEPLSNGEGDVGDAEVISTGSSYTAAWFQIDAADNIVRNVWANTFK